MDYNFVDVMKAFDRMCNKYDYICDVNECPIARLIDVWEKQHDDVWDRDCVYFGSKYPEDFVKAVMQWNEANPPAIYPTTRDIISKIRMLMQIDESNVGYEEFLDMPLNAVAADYFGIEPINKDKLV